MASKQRLVSDFFRAQKRTTDNKLEQPKAKRRKVVEVTVAAEEKVQQQVPERAADATKVAKGKKKEASTTKASPVVGSPKAETKRATRKKAEAAIRNREASVPDKKAEAAIRNKEASVPEKKAEAAATTPKEAPAPEKKPTPAAGPRLDSLPSLEADLPLPRHHKTLLEAFRTVDQVVSMRYNRHEVVRVDDLVKSVRAALRGKGADFGERQLRQIRRAFPQAFHYAWEHPAGRYGGKKTTEYELRVTPNMGYAEDLKAGMVREPEAGGAAGTFVRLDPKALVERRQIFRRILTTLAMAHHSGFLATLSPPLSVPDSELARWHKDFDVEACPEAETADLPAQPDTVRLTKASDVIDATQKLFGVNKRLEKALNDLKEYEAKTEEKKKADKPAAAAPPKPPVKKGLEGLPPAILEKLMAKERAKQAKALTETRAEKREADVLEDLQKTGPLIMNCYRSERQRQGRSALEVKAFAKFVADSHEARKGAAEAENAIRAMVRVAPEFLQFVTIRAVEYVKAKPGAPDLNALREKLSQLYEKAKA